MNRRNAFTLSIVIALCLAAPTIVVAGWAEDPAVNVPICTADEYQSFRALAIVPDGAGGAIIVWDDQRDGTHDVYAQRVDAEGTVLWTSDGVLVGDTEDSWGFNFGLAAVPDGSGGAIIGWVDQPIPPPPAAAEDTDIRAQRVDSTGAILWPVGSPSARGVSVCSADGDQLEISAVSDEDDGAYFVWTDEREMPTSKMVYAQRILADGTRAGIWPLDGKSVVDHIGTRNESQPAITVDTFHGVVIAWKDGRNNPTTNLDIWAQRMTQNGARLWTDAGMAATEANLGQEEPVIVGTGSGGAIIAWVDHRNAGHTGNDIYGQRLRNLDGAIMWEEDGREICVEDRDQQFLAIASDGNSGAVVAWEDRRNDVETLTDIYAQRVNGVGDPLWRGGGVAVCAAEDEQYRPAVAKVGERKWMVVWSDYRGDVAVVAQRYGAWGVREGPFNGLPVSLAPSWQELPVLVPMASPDEAIVAWTDWRNTGTGCDVYAEGEFFGVFTNLFAEGNFEGWSDVVD